MTKLIATNGEIVIIEREDRWGTISVITGLKLLEVIKKEENPDWYNACISKWGFVPIDPVIEVEELEDITIDLLTKAINSVTEW
jgi:hypothetical protein